jgi:hypothetical protein
MPPGHGSAAQTGDAKRTATSITGQASAVSTAMITAPRAQRWHRLSAALPQTSGKVAACHPVAHDRRIFGKPRRLMRSRTTTPHAGNTKQARG